MAKTLPPTTDGVSSATDYEQPGCGATGNVTSFRTGSSVNGLNQLIQHAGSAVTHDSRGNLASDGTRTFSYTTENRLAIAGNVLLAFDPLGRFYLSNANGLWMIYDGDDLVAEWTTSGVNRRYVHGPGFDEPLVWYEGSGTSDRRFLHADERGSIVAVSDGAGTVTAINRYDEYGRGAGTNAGRFQYTGQKWLSEAGVYDYKSRAYDPGLARFLQPDPIGYAGGMNLYAYVGGDPVNLTDSSGLSEEDPFNWYVTYRADPPPQPGGTWDCDNPHLGPCVWRPDVGISSGGSSGPGLGMLLWARSVGMPLGRELLGRGSGGDTGGNRPRQPERPKENPAKRLVRCAAEQYGLDDLVDVGLVAAGQPIRGTKPYVTTGSSKGTSLAGLAANEVFCQARLPVRLPTLVGGAGTGRSLALAWTKSGARFAGRAVPVLGWALLAYDAASVAACVASSGD